MAETMAVATCEKCRNPFEYKPHFSPLKKPIQRHICDACRRGRHHWLNQRWKKNKRELWRNRAKEDRALLNEFMSRRKIGKKLGIPEKSVEDIERRALGKIRSSPELAEVYQHYKEARLPHLGELAGILRTSAGDLMLEYQLQIMDWWQIFEMAMKSGLNDEARQILQDIERCQKLIERELSRVTTG